MDEYVDILDEAGSATGKTALKAEAHRQGWFHPTVHVWFYRPDGKILIQQRGKNKDTHPLLWDVAVAGHVGAGEAIPAAAVRETREEIGLEISENELEQIGIFKSEHYHRPDLIDREFHHCFLCRLKVPLSQLKKQESEVERLAMIPLLQLAGEMFGLAKPHTYVPHTADYYKAVFGAIKERL